MTAKHKVKVIKKSDKQITETALPIEKETKTVTTREMVATVSEWVSDFRERRREDAKHAFEKLFQTQPQTS